jgi:hypothetical protein
MLVILGALIRLLLLTEIVLPYTERIIQSTKSGLLRLKSTTVNHPFDPANKYLLHSFVESSDMKNVYDEVVELDKNGKAEVQLPDWFGELNKDFPYQLTIGSPSPNIYVEGEITNNKFRKAGGKSKTKVSWQLTGIRKDPWADKNRIKVEQEKSSEERDYYVSPEVYNKPSDKSIMWARHARIIKGESAIPTSNTNCLHLDRE